MENTNMSTQNTVALYARVSTADKGQDTEVQLAPLRAYAAAQGLEVVAEYVDAGISGAKRSRPELNRLMADAHQQKFSAIIVARFDRFARSASHLLQALETFQSQGIRFVSINEAIDTNTLAGKMVFTVLAAVAEMERGLIAERVKAGLNHARSKGVKLGRKALDLNITIDPAKSLRQISRESGVALTTLRRRADAQLAA
jgi:DNA invertase Pin-like site-specific DNA recombinase